MVDRLGKYEILRTLGRGAMGEVYLAHHPVIGREVAIKTILPGAAQGVDAEARFRREATAAGQLNHPNLVTIYDFDREGEILYLVMEYVKGEDLEELIRERDLTQAQYLEVLAQVCDGLAYAHKAGIIHRDIKPANVRVVRDGKRLQAKVMDFGIARTEDSNMTSTGIVMGTVSYMAPEYIQSGKATVQADLWAVGVMLYECLAGRKPFHGENTTTVLFKIVSETPRPLEPAEIHGVSTAVRAVLEKALSKDPSQRFLSAEAFAKALRACKDPAYTGGIDEGLTTVVSRMEAAEIRAEAPLLPPTQAVAAAPGVAPATTQVPPASAPSLPGTVGLPVGEPGTVVLPPAVRAPEPGTVRLQAGAEPGTVMLPSAPQPPEVPPAPVASAAPPLRPAVSAAPALHASPAPAPKASSGRGLLVGGIAAGVLLLGVGGWLVLRRPAEPEVQPDVVVPVTQPAASVPTPPTEAATSGDTGAVTPTPAPSPGTSTVPPTATATPKVEAPKATTPSASTPTPTPKVEPPRPEPTVPPEERLRAAMAQLDTDPRAASLALRALVAAPPPGLEARVHGAYLAALYRARSVAEFERAYDQAAAKGLKLNAMMAQAPAFKAVMAEESRAKKAKQEGVIPMGLFQRMLADLQ